MDLVAKAARFIYLNKVAFNGMYRVNLDGKFNVPFGNRRAKIYDPANLRAVGNALRRAQIIAQSYEATLADARHTDFIYLDPPYHPVSATASFTKYTSPPFGETAQVQLATEFRRLTALGCKVALSNSDTEFVKNLYEGFSQMPLSSRRYINANGNGRGPITELLILNY